MVIQRFVRPLIVIILLVVSCLTAGGQSISDEKRRKAIEDLLARPPYFLSPEHPGPTLVPADLPAGVLPFSCRASQAFVRRVRPGAYHFQRAQYLLGEGGDFHGCEIFGLDRFGKLGEVKELEEALKEAEAAVLYPAGMEAWVPGAAEYTLLSAHRKLARAYEKSPDKVLRAHGKELRRVAQHLEALLTKRPSPAERTAPAQDGNVCSAEDLLRAAAENQAQRLRACLDQGLSADTRGIGDVTPLMTAALAGHADTLRLLLNAGANPDAPNLDGATALHHAAATGKLGIVRLLLARGADPNHTDGEGTTSLMDAAALGFHEIVHELLAAGARADLAAEDGATALLAAVESRGFPAFQPRRRSIIDALVGAKAPVNTPDWEGRTPLLVAVSYNDAETVRELLRAGARTDVRDERGASLLHLAAHKQAVEAARLLLEHGMDPNARDSEGETPLMNAVHQGYGRGHEMVQLLVAREADIHTRSRLGYTPLIKAGHFLYQSKSGNWAGVALANFRLLLEKGADIRARTNWGSTVLHNAAQHPGPDDPILLQFLLEAGADIHAANEHGQTPLMFAAERGHASKVRFLISRGADVRVKDKKGRTALDYAKNWKSGSDVPGCIVDEKCEQTRQVLRKAIQVLD